MEPWDITMSDLLAGRAALDSFAGIVFVGGFSYADVLDSAKGWAGTIRRNARLWQQFQDFYNRCGARPLPASLLPFCEHASEFDDI
jgi:phosphoribosylformylglycinamidine synthase